MHDIKIQKEVGEYQVKDWLKKQKRKKKMEYKQYTLEQNPEELNKIMGAVSDKHDVLSDDNEKANNIQLEEEIYQQMNFIKLDNLNALP